VLDIGKELPHSTHHLSAQGGWRDGATGAGPPETNLKGVPFPGNHHHTAVVIGLNARSDGINHRCHPFLFNCALGNLNDSRLPKRQPRDHYDPSLLFAAIIESITARTRLTLSG